MIFFACRYKMLLKSTDFRSDPSIAIRISLPRLISLILERRRLFISFIWLKDHSGHHLELVYPAAHCVGVVNFCLDS